jgi:hypothetical protein
MLRKTNSIEYLNKNIHLIINNLDFSGYPQVQNTHLKHKQHKASNSAVSRPLKNVLTLAWELGAALPESENRCYSH